VTAKGRAPPPAPSIAGASFAQLCENLRSSEGWVRYQTKREFAGRETSAVVDALRAWCDRLDPSDPQTEHAWFEALGVFETHEAIEPRLLRRLVTAKSPGARAYVAGVCARWFDRLPPDFDVTKTLVDLANDPEARVRLAAIVAAANVSSDDAIIVVLSASAQPRDPFIDTALANSAAVLQPRWRPMLAKADALGWKREWIDFLVRTASAPDPRLAKREEPADARTRELMKTAVAPPASSLRATPEFVGALMKEVRAHGQPARGATIFGRAELACIACHSVAGQGATIGPALDGIGSGQPLDFIIGAVLEPQREVKESFEAIEVTTKAGATHLGYRVSEDEKELLLRDLGAGRVVRIARGDIASRRNAGSVMPAGLVDRLSREELRDLFAYLASLGKPIK
jgi:putative heme-binding domain-containing protein